MQMKTWWALVGAKVIFFNFVPFSRLINFVRKCQKTEKKKKNVGSGTQTIALIIQTENSLGPVGSVFKKIF